MKNSISHLNIYKQEEIKAISDIILKLWTNYLKSEMVIVFWDYIKNDDYFINVVKEWDQVVNYLEIIDILVITRRPSKEKSLKLSRKILSQIKNSKNISANINILVEDIFSFNEWISEGRYFYLYILQNWILLFDSWKCKLKNWKNISAEDLKEIKKSDFEAWFEIASEFFLDYKNAFERKSFRMAIFYLHQTVETLITCYLLVKDWYKPKTHDLEILYSKIKSLSEKFNKFFDLETEEYYFSLLKFAYIDARYKKSYEIKREELVFLENKVVFLKWIVEKLCLKEF